jgi:hypothetical protein
MFEDEKIPYALGGALALGAHGVPRGTLDVDINVFVGGEAIPHVVTCLQAAGVYRPKDIADLERLSAVQGAALNRAYVRAWIVDMLGPDDERVATWDRISRSEH